MKEDIEETIKSLQLKIDRSKATLELDQRVQLFIKLLSEYIEAWDILFYWKGRPKPLVIVDPPHFDFTKLKSKILATVSGSHYLREFAYSFFEQYEALETDDHKIRRINEFLKAALSQNFLEPKNECMLFCSECGRTILTNRFDENDECSCGSQFDFKFFLASITGKLMEGIINGHLLEIYASHIMRMVNGVKLIGMGIGEREEKCVYTSIEYAGIGVGDRENGEIDVLGLINNSLIAIECKFNETTYNDVKDFLNISENLLLKIKEKYPSVKMYKIILSYDGTKLKPTNTLRVISLKDIPSTTHLVKQVSQMLR